MGDSLIKIIQVLDFTTMSSKVDRVGLQVVSDNFGCPPLPHDTMFRPLLLIRLNDMSEEQFAFQMIDSLCLQRFCDLMIADRASVWKYANRIGASKLCSSPS